MAKKPGTRSARPRALTAALGTALLALAGCNVFQGPANVGAPLTGNRYVAMGSSFAAGSGFGTLKPGTPQRCGRSFENYATLLAEKTRMTLFDATCGGATTAHILGPWNELPTQIDAVTPDTRLITVTAGGNDLGYVGFLIGESCKVRGPFKMAQGEIPCFEPKVPSEQTYRKLADDMRAIAVEVKNRAPKATLVFVQYIAMVPDTLCDATPINADAAQIARTIGKRLAQITADVAHYSGAMLIEADTLSADHTPCDPQPWAIGYPEGLTLGEGAPWHPSRAGHAAIADILAERLGG